jgi:hypothetical protein
LEFQGIKIGPSDFKRFPQIIKELKAEQVDEVEKLLEKSKRTTKCRTFFTVLSSHHPSKLINVIADSKKFQ